MSPNLNSFAKNHSIPFIKDLTKTTPPVEIPQVIIYNHVINHEESYPLKGVENISIVNRRSRVKFFPTTSEDIKVKISGAFSTTDSNSPSIQLVLRHDAVLRINTLQYEGLGYTNIENLCLEIYIPTSYRKKVDLQTICSPIEVDELWGGEICFEAVSSNISIHQLMVKSSMIHTVSGDISIAKTTGDLNLETIAGNVNVKVGDDSKLNIKTITGTSTVALSHSDNPSLSYKTITGDFNSRIVCENMYRDQSTVSRINLHSVTGNFNII